MSGPYIQSRRTFFTGLSGLAAGLLAPRAFAKGPVKTISIIHTTDLHGHILPSTDYGGQTELGGFARCASMIRQWQKMFPNNLLVDVGDLYQGAAASRFSRGKMMIELLNLMNYDSWVLGNHEFDWGLDVVEEAVQKSSMPVLTANLKLGDQMPGKWKDGHSLQNIHPYMIKEVAGFKVAVIGLITPGLPYWLRPELLKGIEPLDPVQTLQACVNEVKQLGANAVVVTGHMGFKWRDDYANPLRDLLGKVKGVDVYIGGHSHVNMPSWRISKVLCTQSSYHGMHCGRVDLTFDLDSKKLISRHVCTNLMDDRFQLDPLVLKHASPYIETANEALSKKVADVPKLISQEKGEVRELLCKAFLYAAQKRDWKADTVFHGTFDKGDIKAGPMTMEDVWYQIPYENWLVSVEVSAKELSEILTEASKSRYNDRGLLGYQASKADGFIIRDQNGKALEPDHRITVILNSYDAQSGGRRFMKLREIAQQKEAKAKMLPLDTRDAFAEYLLDGKLDDL